MGLWRYWYQVVNRAIVATLELYGLHRRGRAVVALFLFVLAILVLRFLPGGALQLNDEVRWAAAVVLAAAVLFVPIFGYHLLTIPAAIDSVQRTALAELRQREDDVGQVIAHLREYIAKLDSNDREDYGWLLLECADELASGGITPSAWEDQAYKGMPHHQLTRFLSRLRIKGIVEVRHRTIERDRGYPYQVQDYYLSDFGAHVVARLEQELREQYPDDD